MLYAFASRGEKLTKGCAEPQSAAVIVVTCIRILLNSLTMQRAITADLPRSGWIPRITSRARIEAPTRIEWTGALATAILLILSFPNLNLPFLAWLALLPLLAAVAYRPSRLRAFVLGWAAGSIFFYGSCYWLTYSMIHYGGLPSWVAYLLLAPIAATVGLFPALFGLLLANALKRFGQTALLLAPVFWCATEWLRLEVTGQLWNAIGYSQAEFLNGLLIQPARWGGVYLIGFLIVSVNGALAFALVRRKSKDLAIALAIITAVMVFIALAARGNQQTTSVSSPNLYVVALQPNVPMTMIKTVTEMDELRDRHFLMTTNALKLLPSNTVPRLVVWPESPMNFTYASDRRFQELVTTFARENHTSLLFNSLEPAAGEGSYNSALLINEDGRLISQYDKIRLLPFGEYVPLPTWLGGSLISGLVGDFTAGTHYTLMPVGDHRVGVFICIESAYPSIAKKLTSEGADVLINISNDGYLGPTAVMHQHLANAIFRSVENGRPLLRVTNSGLSAKIKSDGAIEDITKGFQPDIRIWTVTSGSSTRTFYTAHGDIFVELCTVMTVLILVATFYRRRSSQLLDER